MTTVVILEIPGDGTWTVPADWSDNNLFAVFGGGANGSVHGPSFFAGHDGGGGNCAVRNGVTGLVPGQVVNLHIGVRIAGSGDHNGTNGDPSWIGANDPTSPSCIAYAAGGTNLGPPDNTHNKGDVVHLGGPGQNGDFNFPPAPGAGGAAGPTADGQAGNSSGDGGAGENGLGGAGGVPGTGGADATPGADGINFHGRGAGGGGGSNGLQQNGSHGGDGGKYGGGGASGGWNAGGGVGGAGAQGGIIITYEPNPAPDPAALLWTGFEPLVFIPNPSPMPALLRWFGYPPSVDYVPAPVPNPGPAELIWTGFPPIAHLQASLDWRATVISQYANSPTLLQLVANLATYFDPAANFDDFYNLMWNVDTAQGYGLDVWGRIVGVGRVLHIPSAFAGFFGFQEATDAHGWDQAPFWSQASAQPLTQNFTLSDTAYRQLILAKAAANICDGSIPAINAILRSLFQSFGNAFVADNEDMTITYTFTFPLTPVQLAIIEQSGVIPKPAGVSFTVSHP